MAELPIQRQRQRLSAYNITRRSIDILAAVKRTAIPHHETPYCLLSRFSF
ncbi:MAG: hypothetical protein GPJ00_20580 [Microcystis aeruginosa W13-18]|nr:hypothetical protein [Microcystis aeruginosa W13-18]